MKTTPVGWTRLLSWRTDIHRVIKDYWGNLELNDIGGSDALFFAFKNQEDCFMFKLKWGGG